MNIVHTIKDVKSIIKKWKDENLSIGYVPTMGYLHEGHASLIKKAREENDKVIVSIFVNPIQFGPKEDYSTYPRDLDKDSSLCEKFGADLVFNPETSEMYPNKIYSHVNVDILTENLCGEKRPVHFQGVCTVLTKFFNILNPTKAYFGEKDAQQLTVVKKMVEDLNFPIEIIGCPIIREEDGLAKSSRNAYLNKQERKSALILNKSLKEALKSLKSGEKDLNIIKNIIINTIMKEPLAKIDYISIVDSTTLQPVEKLQSSILIAIAVYIGKTRLIDNFTFKL
ncbi:pantoate--beta-alanine ligase [Clostridium botulinum]|uniref:Pantothenate synthetase n=2 Tax=Clostridium botulinum TaxID=1491 RepID=PANC_CLOBM|nr:pantoate--beta-alanine ligase [Clostridium botulinum]B1KUY6.1 RecName: Full=Pantothenate synthetase; Short=PS; AltName: Full=Pantoate--beta-alanine ligase; AltName: Full=Pantoate-activating enzyme [Clostridium botulinum A3 str. Loch Maree]ACA56426.1 pantoate--beta-alanine ligase [Clostridium botulinum A3 str. Loch Maree]NFH66782.1 pantoate--beta-alanine ligase [Clostridium botulinum]NFJ06921.1 pantoate--beta-alanine ligase [Clostridium botulinum]NFK13893.1 pantoate--beta-alanine ligase [Clo